MKTLEEITKFVVYELACCQVCQCENGKKMNCACHKKQLKDFIESTISQTKLGERKAIKKRLDKMIIGNEDAIMVAVKAYRTIDNRQK